MTDDHPDVRLARLVLDAWFDWQTEPAFPFDRSHCINGARCAISVLGKLGVKARPVSVGLAFFNRFAWDLFSAGIPVPEWPKHAWSIGINSNDDDANGRWGGHLMVEGDGFTIDVSCRQFDRPGLLVVDEGWLFPPIPPIPQVAELTDELGQRLMVWRTPENSGWRHATGWKRLHTEQVTELHDRTLTRLSVVLAGSDL